MKDCIFCKIARKEIATELIYEDNDVIAFNDISKQAPIHILIIPKQHLDSVLDTNENNNIISRMHFAICKVAKMKEIDKTGFRLINNCGKDAHQTVMHLHYHLLGGTNLGGRILCNDID